MRRRLTVNIDGDFYVFSNAIVVKVGGCIICAPANYFCDLYLDLGSLRLAPRDMYGISIQCRQSDTFYR
ncbi:MAG: hypothetical protein C5S52_00370 [ANME-2 cluster archaeon]|nr:hypothetical protein [ANME-2 cluster archaeon]